MGVPGSLVALRAEAGQVGEVVVSAACVEAVALHSDIDIVARSC